MVDDPQQVFESKLNIVTGEAAAQFFQDSVTRFLTSVFFMNHLPSGPWFGFYLSIILIFFVTIRSPGCKAGVNRIIFSYFVYTLLGTSLRSQIIFNTVSV